MLIRYVYVTTLSYIEQGQGPEDWKQVTRDGPSSIGRVTGVFIPISFELWQEREEAVFMFVVSLIFDDMYPWSWWPLKPIYMAFPI